MDLSKLLQPAKAAPKFIPREELGKVSAWSFGDIHGRDRKPPPEPELTPSERAALDKGYRAGLEAGRAEAQAQSSQAIELFYESTGADVSRRMSSLCEAYEQQLKGLEQNLAGEVLDLAFDIARQLIRTELATQPKAIEPMVHEAVNLVLASGAVTHLRLARPDLEALQDGLQPLVDSGKLRCSVDPSVTPGGCILESGLSVIDATLEKRWARVLANFGRHPEAGETP